MNTTLNIGGVITLFGIIGLLAIYFRVYKATNPRTLLETAMKKAGFTLTVLHRMHDSENLIADGEALTNDYEIVRFSTNKRKEGLEMIVRPYRAGAKQYSQMLTWEQ